MLFPFLILATLNPQTVTADDVQPFLVAHCQACHGDEQAEGEFRVDTLTTNFANLQQKAAWSEIVNVLNSHEMPPEDEPQPEADEVAKVVDWITQQVAAAERANRESAIVLRRLNRQEYKNTIRDLLGVEVDVAGFPEDPPAGGFDNNGSALTLSPLLMELYFKAASEAIDAAITPHPAPAQMRWRIQPESGDGDHNRVSYDGQRIIVNGGKNAVSGDYKVMHHASWDRTINFRDFALPDPGKYIIRIRAAGKVPSRDEVVASAETFLRERMQRDIEKNPSRQEYEQRAFTETLEHFRQDPMYDYGPPRLKLIQTLAGQPRVIAEFDVDAALDSPQEYEIAVDFSTDKAGVTIEYAYSIPKELENFWFQTADAFARPELWVDWIELEGPVYDMWPPRSHRDLLQSDSIAIAFEDAAQQREHAAKVLRRFLQRAYRRRITPAELDEKMQLFDAAIARGADFTTAIRVPLIATLVSPNFLYLSEPHGSQAGGERINAFELASRLSYFLWSSMPDDELFRLAAENKLNQPDILRGQVDRMLADPKSQAFVENFAGQWLELRQVGANPPAADLYPRYDRHLEESMTQESLAFFAEILHNDLDIANFVSADFVVVNERMARYYGIEGVRGDHFRRVPVTSQSHRGGVVTQASVLCITSNGTRTSPVKRGTWIMKNLLGIDPGLPVANAGDIAPKVPGIDKATVRQRLEIHRQLPQCARCHNKIDPLGFALENYNAAGYWREREGFGYKGRIGDHDPLIDASAKMIDGTTFEGVDGLRTVLLDKRELFYQCLARKLFTYALGRELGIADGRVIKAAAQHLQDHAPTLRELIYRIVASEVFQQT